MFSFESLSLMKRNIKKVKKDPDMFRNREIMGRATAIL